VTKTPLSLKQAAMLITQRSGHALKTASLRHLIVRGQWPYEAFRLADIMEDYSIIGCLVNNEWGVWRQDALRFARTYNGLKRGRPLLTPITIGVRTQTITAKGSKQGVALIKLMKQRGVL